MTDGNGSRLQGLTGEASDVNDDSAKEKEREEVPYWRLCSVFR